MSGAPAVVDGETRPEFAERVDSPARKLLAVAPVTHPGGAETTLLRLRRFDADLYTDHVQALIVG